MRKTVRVSDLSGTEIPAHDLVAIKVDRFPSENDVTELDVSRAEVENLFGGRGHVTNRRGRKKREES